MSLFHYLLSNGFKIIVAHVNHKKRTQSDQEYIFLEDYCKKNNVPFRGHILGSISGNFQEAARKERYNFFMEVARKFNTKYIITAHQADDLVETILMRINRGTSLRGYRGIQYTSFIDEYKIIRPMLYTSRDEIKEYQKAFNVPYFEDSSNSENHYSRNKIRHNVIPTLKEINPNIYSSFINYSEDLSLMYEYINKKALEFINNSSLVKKNEISYMVDDLYSLDEIVKRQVILKSVNIISNDSLELTHERLKEIANTKYIDESKEIELSSDISVSFEYKKIVFYKKENKEKVNLVINDFGEYEVKDYGKIIVSQKYHLLPNKNSYMLCYNNMDLPLYIKVRNIEFGDKITINGITKKVYDILKDEKVPKRKRESIICMLNKDDEIIFIPGLKRKETDKSKENVLYITYLED